jgi:hypothetical protein
MRKPDQPGDYRVRLKGGEWVLSGLQRNGSRVKLGFSTEGQARNLASALFGAPTVVAPIVDAVAAQLDDWGLPKITVASAASSNAALGIAPVPVPQQPNAQPSKPPESEAQKKERNKRSQSLMELIGMGWAAGDVMLARKWVDGAGKEPVKPNPKQVNDLADSMKDTLQDWFGDREIKPWQMTFLLSLGIPIAMYLQSKPKAKLNEAQAQPNPLKSVP